MSVATEGVEEMLFEGARGTRFSSKVTQENVNGFDLSDLNSCRVNHCKRYWDFIEYIKIAVPGTTRRNPNPAQASTAVVLQNNRPNRPPYGIYWDVAGNPPVYFTYTWNNHLLLACGWAIDFNIVLNAIP
ncbi:11908_t:CDS:2 [Rhizophagus irregularis]|nr:11908_t:CDS:2 [Rhizophagus irregularis]